MRNYYSLNNEINSINYFIEKKIIIKNAQSDILGSLFSAVSRSVPDAAKKENTLDGVLKFLTPGIISAGFYAIGGFWPALISGAIASAFDLNIGSLLSSIKDALISKKNVSADDVSNIVDQEVDNHIGDPSTSQIEGAMTASNVDVDNLELNDNKNLKKLNLFITQEELFKQGYTISRIKKIAGAERGFFVSIISTIISFIIKAFLISCGFAFAKYLVKKIIGTEDKDQSSIAVKKSSQKIFRISPSYNAETHKEPWIIYQPSSEIDDVLLDWMVEVYPTTSNYRDLASNLSSFKMISHLIKRYNAQHNLNVTYIPPSFYTKLMVVDQFIDELASKVSYSLKSQ